MPFRPSYLDDDAFDLLGKAKMDDMLQDAVASVRLPSMLDGAVRGVRASLFGSEDATSWTPMPIVVSDRPDAMQIRDQQREQAVAMPGGSAPTNPAPSGTASVSPGGPTASSGTPAAMPSGADPSAAPASYSAASGGGAIDNSSRESFIRTAYPHALQAAGGNVARANQQLAIALSENGDIGTGKDLSSMGFNFSGVHAQPGEPSFMSTDAGRPTAFRSYANPAEGLDGFFSFLESNPRYAGALANYRRTGDIDQLTREANAAGYSETPDWQDRIAEIRRTQVEPFTQGSAAPRPGVTTPPQAEQTEAAQRQASGDLTPDQTALDDPDKWALCGPVAAVAMARARGGNWTVAQAKAYAVKNGLWNADQGMGGLEAEANLLRGMGYGAKTGAVDWQQAAQDAATGNPVTLSTRFIPEGHYVVLEQYDAQTGKFYVGGLGSTLKKTTGMSKWMSPAELQALGPIEGALHFDNPASPTPSVAAAPNAGAASPPAPAAPAPAAATPPAAAGAPVLDAYKTGPEDVPDDGPSAGDQKRQKLGLPMPGSVYGGGGGTPYGAEGGPTEMDPVGITNGNMRTGGPDWREPGMFPYDVTDDEGLDRSNDPLYPVPTNRPPRMSGNGVPDSPYDSEITRPSQMYRNPLGAPTMGPDTATGEPFDPRTADSGPRESGYALPPSQYGAGGDDPGAAPLQNNNTVANLSPESVIPDTSVGRASDDPGGAGFAARDAYSTPVAQPARYDPYGGASDPTDAAMRQTTPDAPAAAPTSPSSSMLPVWDENDQVVGYRQVGPSENANSRRQARGDMPVTSTAGEPDYVAPPRTIRSVIEPVGGMDRMSERMRQIEANAARELGVEHDPIATMRAPSDPRWRAANPEMAAEYDSLSDQYMMTVAGQLGDAPNLRHGPQAPDSAAVPSVGSRIGSAFDEGRRVAAEATAADDGSRMLSSVGPAPAPESRIPGAGYTDDLRPGAEAAIRQDVERNAVSEPIRRADVARKAQDIIGLDPETARHWQDEALTRDEAAPVVRSEALRQARVIDAEHADRALDNLRAAQERAQAAGGAANMGQDDKLDAAAALLEAAEAARAMQRSGAADTAEARAAARILNQRKQSVVASQAFEAAQRARQVGQDAAFAAREVQRAAATGRVTPQGEQRLRTLRDKLLEAERHGLVGDGANGRLSEMERPESSTTAAVAVGPVSAPNPRLRSQASRPGVGLGTRIASDVGNSVLGSLTGGTAGYLAPAGSDEERRQNMQTGAVVGAVGFPIVGRTLGRGRGGVKALLGPVPTPENPQRAIAIGADPATRYEMRYRVVDLGDLVPSNLPNGAPNPAFPRELQPRSRERAASQLQIDGIAQKLDPIALLHDAGRLDSGPPIIGADNLVESGNGRTLAIQRAAEQHPERYQAYVDTLRQNLGEFGLSDADMQGMQRPVLVRERVTPVDRPSFVQEANGSVTQRMSAAETAAQSAANLSDDVVTQLNIGENDSIAAALRRTDNRDLVRQWLGALPENERGAFLDKSGDISPQGYDALANALLARTYGDGAATRAFIEAGDGDIRGVQNAVMGSLPDMARAEALIRGGLRDPGLSVAQDVARATEVLTRLKNEKMSVGDYIKQMAMGDRELTPFQEQVLQFLDQNQRRPSTIRQTLREYADVVENAADPNQSDMFGGAVASVSKEDAWASATAGAQRERQARIAARQARSDAENAARTPAADIVPSTNGPEGMLAQEGAPPRLAAPTQAERGALPTGGPEGALAVEGAPVGPASLPAMGDLSTGGPEGSLTLSSGRSVKDVAAQIDEVLANPNAPGAADRLRELHADLQEISTQGFARSSDIRRRLQRNGLLRAGLAAKDQNVDHLVQALANVDPDHPEQMRAVMEIISKPRLIDRILEYQYVNMLSSPITQGINITSNTMQLAGRLFFQNPLEYVYSGGQSTGVGAAFQGAARGFREARSDVAQIMRTGVNPQAVENATETGNYSQVGRELMTEKFGKAGAVLHAISTRPLQAMDALFGQMAYASAAEQHAQRTADRLLRNGSETVKGMSREQARAHVMANIWDYPEIVEKAGRIQDYTLLKSNDASDKGFGILERQLRQMAALGHAPEDANFSRQVLAFSVNNVLPFFSVPLNSAKQGIERTVGVPVNAVRAGRAYARGDVERGAELAAKATIGAAAVTTAGMLALGDNLTGPGPGGSEQAIWEQDHRRNSWRVPGTQTWFSWEGTPLAIPFGMVAGVKQGWSEANERSDKKGQTDALDRIGSAALKGGQGAVEGFTSQSFIRAMGDQYQLLTGQQTGLGTVANQVTSNISRAVPASGMLNFLAKVTDTMERDPGKPQSFSDLPENIGARSAMRIPGLRQQVDPKLTPYGQPTRNEQFGPAGLLPYYRGAGVGANDPINQTVEKAGQSAITAPTEVPAGVTEGVPIPLNMQQRRVFAEAAGQKWRQILEGNHVESGRFSEQALDHFRAQARQAGVVAALGAMTPAERQAKVRATQGQKQPAGAR